MTRIFQCRTCGGIYIEAQTDGSVYFHACPPQSRDPVKGTLEYVNKRDENVAVDRKGKHTGITAEGDGVTCLNDGSVSEPVWITRLKLKLLHEKELENVASDV